MKKITLLSLVILGYTTNLFPQARITIDNLNGFGDTTATSFGLFFDWNWPTWSHTPYSSSPINVSVYGGPTPTNMVLIATLAGTNALVNYTPGVYYDPNRTSYIVPGVAPGSNAWLQVRAWRGSAASYEQSSASDRFNPTSGLYPKPSVPCNPPGPVPFQGSTGVGSYAPSLDGMPALGILAGVCISQPGYKQGPTNQVVLRGGTAVFDVVFWPDGVYPGDWRHNGEIITGTYYGAGQHALVITNVQPTDAGIYTYHEYGCGCYYNDVEVSATLTVINNTLGLSVADHPSLTVEGTNGQKFTIQSTTNLALSNAWTSLTNLTLTAPNIQWTDSNVVTFPAGELQRYYRVLPMP